MRAWAQVFPIRRPIASYLRRMAIASHPAAMWSRSQFSVDYITTTALRHGLREATSEVRPSFCGLQHGGVLLGDLLGGRAGVEGCDDRVQRHPRTCDTHDAVGISVNRNPFNRFGRVEVKHS
jgi:hypothetical protein